MAGEPDNVLFIPGEEVRAVAGATVADEASGAGGPVPANQPEPFANSKLAGILAKKERGEPLTRAEAGYLGGVRKKAKPVATTASTPANVLLQPPPNPENLLFESSPQVTATAPASAAPAYDSALLRRTANAMLSSFDLGTKIYVGYEAKQAGSDKETIEAYKSAVALQDGNRQLMLDGSDPIIIWLCEKFKCTPDKLEGILKNSGFIGGAFMHLVGVVTAVKSIRESKKEREASKQPAEAK